MQQKTLMLLGAVFLLPLIAAAMVLHFGWYQAGTANKGTWVKSDMLFEPLQSNPSLPEAWKLTYVMPNVCQAHCQSMIKNMEKGYSTLGRKQVQLKLILLQSTTSQALTTASRMSSSKHFSTITLPENLHEQLQTGSLYLVDHQGQFILRYSAGDDGANYAQLTRDWLADTKRLLAYSRKSA